MKKEKLEKRDYEIYFLQGNSISIVSCGAIDLPGINDFFLTAFDITFPDEPKLEILHIPKHLLLQVKTKLRDVVPNHLKVVPYAKS
jgi:hypothetical protein